MSGEMSDAEKQGWSEMGKTAQRIAELGLNPGAGMHENRTAVMEAIGRKKLSEQEVSEKLDKKKEGWSTKKKVGAVVGGAVALAAAGYAIVRGSPEMGIKLAKAAGKEGFVGNIAKGLTKDGGLGSKVGKVVGELHGKQDIMEAGVAKFVGEKAGKVGSAKKTLLEWVTNRGTIDMPPITFNSDAGAVAKKVSNLASTTAEVVGDSNAVKAAKTFVSQQGG